PWTARAAIKKPALLASAQAADAATNRARPATKVRRRPKRSPSAAPVKSSTAKLRLYAFIVHCSASIEAPRSRRIVLRAVVTTNASSATINDATEVSASTQAFSALSLDSVIIFLASLLRALAAVRLASRG